MASAAVQNKTPRKVLKKSTRDSLIAYSFIAPNFIGFCVFTLVPMVFAIALAFCAWDGRHAIEFVGLKNFVKLFTTDKIFHAALKNTNVGAVEGNKLAYQFSETQAETEINQACVAINEGNIYSVCAISSNQSPAQLAQVLGTVAVK